MSPEPSVGAVVMAVGSLGLDPTRNRSGLDLDWQSIGTLGAAVGVRYGKGVIGFFASEVALLRHGGSRLTELFIIDSYGQKTKGRPEDVCLLLSYDLNLSPS